MEESAKKRVYQTEIIGAMVLVVIAVLSFLGEPGITGFVSLETKSQDLNLSLANSQSYILTTNSKDPFYLTSIRLSGEVIGDGIVKVYIEDAKGAKILIYSNIIKKEQGLNPITGMSRITGNVVGVDSTDSTINTTGNYLVIDFLENINDDGVGKLGENEEINSGAFQSRCIDSCFVQMLLKENIAYQLVFYIESGTFLNINKIDYTVKKE